jgi:hypothetical protein
MVGMEDGELAFNAVIIMEGLFQGARNAAAQDITIVHTAGTSPACPPSISDVSLLCIHGIRIASWA